MSDSKNEPIRQKQNGVWNSLLIAVSLVLVLANYLALEIRNTSVFTLLMVPEFGFACVLIAHWNHEETYRVLKNYIPLVAQGLFLTMLWLIFFIGLTVVITVIAMALGGSNVFLP